MFHWSSQVGNKEISTLGSNSYQMQVPASTECVHPGDGSGRTNTDLRSQLRASGPHSVTVKYWVEMLENGDASRVA